MERMTPADLAAIGDAVKGLVGVQFDSLALPSVALRAFEPSQIGAIVGSLMDALIPHLPDAHSIGLTRAPGQVGERESYPDYLHGRYRLELKLIYVDNPDLAMKRPPTRREPSARLTQKVTVRNVVSATDAMLLISYQLRPNPRNRDAVSPTIIDFRLFPMADLIAARDERLASRGGRWSGHYETPLVLSKIGQQKAQSGEDLDVGSFGRREGEGKDYNEDTNFGKLARIPHEDLRDFIRRCQALSLGISPALVDSLPEGRPDRRIDARSGVAAAESDDG